MYVDVRWIILAVVAAGVVLAAVLQPTLIPAFSLGVAVSGLLYILLRLGDGTRSGDRPEQSKERQGD
jgi:hypothetical protein